MKFLLAFLLLLCAAGTPTEGLLVIPLLLVAHFFGRSALALGLCVPLAPLLTPSALTVMGLLYLLLNSSRVRTDWVAPILTVLAVWALVTFYWEFDPQALAMTTKHFSWWDTLGFVRRMLLVSPPHYYTVLVPLAAWTLIGGVTSIVSGSVDERREILKGIVVGSSISLLITVYTVWTTTYCLNNRQSSFWSSIARYCGTFSDPNAYGVAVALILPLIISSGAILPRSFRVLAYALVTPLTVIGLFSGSRTFVLSIGLYGLISIWFWKRHVLLLALGLFAISIVVINAAQLDPGTLPLPSSLVRTVESVSLSTLSQSFFSRSLFWRLSLDLWWDYPIFGSGPERFRDLLPIYLKRRAVDIGGWSDNPNSFYLGTLAELGAVGGVALLLCFLQLRWTPLRYPVERWARIGLSVFGVSLFLGPHLEFPEVAILFGILLGSATYERGEISRRYYLLALPTLGGFIAYASYSRDHGFYRWEEGRFGSFRWSSGQAYGHLPCQNGAATLKVTTSDPRAASLPPQVTIIGKEETQVLTVRPGQVKEVRIRCVKGLQAYQLRVSRVWVPSEVGMGADSRVLGVQVHSPMIIEE